MFYVLKARRWLSGDIQSALKRKTDTGDGAFVEEAAYESDAVGDTVW
jgi:hypothetical protein